MVVPPVFGRWMNAGIERGKPSDGANILKFSGEKRDLLLNQL